MVVPFYVSSLGPYFGYGGKSPRGVRGGEWQLGGGRGICPYGMRFSRLLFLSVAQNALISADQGCLVYASLLTAVCSHIHVHMTSLSASVVSPLCDCFICISFCSFEFFCLRCARARGVVPLKE